MSNQQKIMQICMERNDGIPYATFGINMRKMFIIPWHKLLGKFPSSAKRTLTHDLSHTARALYN